RSNADATRQVSARPWTGYSAPSCHPTPAATSRPSPAKPESPAPGSTPAPTPHGNQKPGPYQHLADEFHRRLQALHEAGTIPDPREQQITRLKTENAALRQRVETRDREITELTAFKESAISQLAAQHDEINRL